MAGDGQNHSCHLGQGGTVSRLSICTTVADRAPVRRAHLLLDHLSVAPDGGRPLRVGEVPRPHRDPLPAGDAARRPRRPLRRRALGNVVVLGDCK